MKIKVYYVVRVVDGEPDQFGTRKQAREDVGKFFSQKDAEAFEKTLSEKTELRVAEEDDGDQHPAHKGHPFERA